MATGVVPCCACVACLQQLLLAWAAKADVPERNAKLARGREAGGGGVSVDNGTFLLLGLAVCRGRGVSRRHSVFAYTGWGAVELFRTGLLRTSFSFSL